MPFFKKPPGDQRSHTSIKFDDMVKRITLIATKRTYLGDARLEIPLDLNKISSDDKLLHVWIGPKSSTEATIISSDASRFVAFNR